MQGYKAVILPDVNLGKNTCNFRLLFHSEAWSCCQFCLDAFFCSDLRQLGFIASLEKTEPHMRHIGHWLRVMWSNYKAKFQIITVILLHFYILGLLRLWRRLRWATLIWWYWDYISRLKHKEKCTWNLELK